MERILFLVPPTIDYQKFKEPPEHVRALPKKDGVYGSVLTDMPLGVLALSSYLKLHCEVAIDVIDFNVALNKVDEFPHENFLDFFREYIAAHVAKEQPPTFIGISTLFRTSYTNMLDLANVSKELFPDTLVFAGGGVPTNMYEKIFVRQKILIFCFSEGENTSGFSMLGTRISSEGMSMRDNKREGKVKPHLSMTLLMIWMKFLYTTTVYLI